MRPRRTQKVLLICLGAIFFVALMALLGVYLDVKRQSPTLTAGRYDLEQGSAVVDADGVPTIEAGDWQTLVTAQGYVVASERLWQMDLMRRLAAGRLSEWFGRKTLASDTQHVSEDWLGVATRAYDLLPPDEKLYCDAYAHGVNRFIAKARDHMGSRWGIEYVLLGVEPEPWTCRDTLLLIMNLGSDMTSSAALEARESLWRLPLPSAWSAFLFPQDHPWNVPLFGKGKNSGPVLPPQNQWLPPKPINPQELLDPVKVSDVYRPGSNNWAWRGKTGYFLANDPHLHHSVPGLWYLVRLRTSPTDWLVGASLPGIPGVILGMNPHLAWAFTNTGEDVDDYLQETLSADHSQYLYARENGREVWRPVEKRVFHIKVRGEPDALVTAQFTARGPLAQRPHLGQAYYSRQWVGFDPHTLSLPAIELGRASSWTKLNAALDKQRIAAQNVVMVDRAGNMGYRVSGTGVIRTVSGQWPQPALLGAWSGYQPASARRRLLIPHDQGASAHLETANNRIWVDRFGDNWFNDERVERARRVLQSRQDLSEHDMERLQYDTQSRYYQELARWLCRHAMPKSIAERETVERLKAWDGFADSDSLAFAAAVTADNELVRLLLGRVKQRFLPGVDIPYQSPMQRAWTLTIYENDDTVKAFGVNPRDAAQFILARLAPLMQAAPSQLFPNTNRWATQHPFVGAIPFIGQLFAVKEYPHSGHRGLLKCEEPTFGPSVRLVWDLSDPLQSAWGLPVGESGHVGSSHYDDLQAKWFSARYMRVFDAQHEWRFADPRTQSL